MENGGVSVVSVEDEIDVHEVQLRLERALHPLARLDEILDPHDIAGAVDNDVDVEIHARLEYVDRLHFHAGRQMRGRFAGDEFGDLLVVVRAADELHKRIAQHGHRFLDRQRDDDRRDEEISGVMQEVERRAVGQKIQQHGDDADAERDHAVDPRAVRLRLEHEARVAERAVACAVIRDERDADGRRRESGR